MAEKTKKSDRKRAAVERSLMEQLEAQGKTAAFYTNLVSDYMHYYDIKQQLFDDIAERGAVVEVTSGNGFTRTGVNESIQTLQKTSATMLKILHDLDLREPVSEVGADDYL